MNIKYDTFGKIEKSNIYLCKPNKGKFCALNGIDETSFSYEKHLQDFDVIEFTVDRYIDIDGEKVESNGYSVIDYFMEIEVDNIGRFIITEPPTTSNDGFKEQKQVRAESLEYKLMSRDLVDFKVNTGELTSIERTIDGNINEYTQTAINYIKVYDKKNPKYSLMDILVNEYINGWTVGYVDPLIANKTPYFSIDSTNVYAFLTQDMTKTLQCIFKFDTLERTINIYGEESIGKNTGIYISFRNLQNSLDVSPQTSDIYTRYTVQGADGLDIAMCNFGEEKIEDISYFLNTNYMKQELIDKYKSYQSYRESKRTEYIDVTKNRAKAVVDRDEIINKVPLDALNMEWNKFSYDELREELEYFQGIVNVMLQDCLKNPLDTEEKIENKKKEIKNLFNNSSYKTSSYMTKLNNALDLYVKGITTATENFSKEQSNDNLDALVNSLYTIVTITDLNNIYNGTFTWFSDINYNNFQKTIYWYDFETYTTYIIPNIKTAIKNVDLIEDDKIDYDDGWVTEWERYGTEELKTMISMYQERMKALSEYKREWSSLSSDEKSKYSKESVYNTFHDEYIDTKSKYDGAKSQYDNLVVMVEDYNKRISEYDAQLSSIVDDVSIENSKFGFTKSDLLIIRDFYYDTDYTNQNFYAPDYYSISDKVDEELALLEYAKTDLAKQSRPQWAFSTSCDNLLALNDYKDWHGQLDVGNFIRVGTDDVHSEKLRIIGMSFNPMLYDNNLSLTFSNMMKWNNQRNDFTELFDDASSSRKNSISKGSSSGNDSTSLSSDLINYILNSQQMKGTISNAKFESLSASQGTFNTVLTDYLRTDQVDAKIGNFIEVNSEKIFADYMKTDFANIKEGVAEKFLIENLTANILTTKIANMDKATIVDAYIQNGFMDYLNANLAYIKEINVDDLKAKMAVIDIADIGQMSADSAFIRGLTTLTTTTITSTVDTQFVKDLIVGHITAADIFSTNITSDYMVIGHDDDDNKIKINGSTILFTASENGVDVPYIQLGTDASGGHSLILKDSNGNIMLDGTGITTNAVVDGLIEDRMVKRKSTDYTGISADALNINSVTTALNSDGGLTINSNQVYWDEDDYSLKEKFSNLTLEVERATEELVVVIESSQGHTIEPDSETTLTAKVYYNGDPHECNRGGIKYQWYHEEELIPGATTKQIVVDTNDLLNGYNWACAVEVNDDYYRHYTETELDMLAVKTIGINGMPFVYGDTLVKFGD